MGFWRRKARPLLKLHHLMSKQLWSPHEKVTLTRNEIMCKTTKYYPKSKLSGSTIYLRLWNFEARTEKNLQPKIAHTNGMNNLISQNVQTFSPYIMHTLEFLQICRNRLKILAKIQLPNIHLWSRSNVMNHYQKPKSQLNSFYKTCWVGNNNDSMTHNDTLDFTCSSHLLSFETIREIQKPGKT